MFKVGDKVKVTRAIVAEDKPFVGKIGIIIRSYNNDDGWITNLAPWQMLESQLKLIKGGKKMKPEKIDKHAVVIDSCDNLAGIRNSFKEAEMVAKSCGAEEPCTIYRMTPVARAAPEVKVTKIKK